MKISVLCKVVDNFGDIGVVWRLCKSLKKNNFNLSINLIVDGLSTFKKICPEVSENQKIQKIKNINIFDWNCNDFCYEEFCKNDGENLSFILECFQCGRPSWMEKILFEDKLKRTVNIIMIDYLTAEKYAEDFHCLKSLTRSAKVQKINFMPGFTNKTGGLIIDDEWKILEKRNSNGPVLIFTYEKNSKPLINAINDWAKLKNNAEIILPQGRGLVSLENEINFLSKKNFNFSVLDYLSQENWDKMMKNCSVLFVRGEESMSRACLSGIPFVWQAYPQSDDYQIVKVNALLEQLKNYFSQDNFKIISDAWIFFNTDGKSDFGIQEKLFLFLENVEKLAEGFSSFALNLRKNGDLVTNLMTFIEKNYIIKE